MRHVVLNLALNFWSECWFRLKKWRWWKPCRWSAAQGGREKRRERTEKLKKEREEEKAKSRKPSVVCSAASKGHATALTTLSTLSTQNLHHMLWWLCKPILAKTPLYYLLRENDGDYHKVFPSRMSVKLSSLLWGGEGQDGWEAPVWPLAFWLDLVPATPHDM